MGEKSKTDLLEFAFASAEAEYKDLSETWKLIDTKAQATTAIAGVFLAAVFNFVRPPGVSLAAPLTFLLGLSVGALVVSVLFALLAMRVRSVPALPASEEAARMVTDLLAMPEAELEARHRGLLADTVNVWLPVNRQLQAANATKASWLERAQWCLMGAAILVAIVTISVL